MFVLFKTINPITEFGALDKAEKRGIIMFGKGFFGGLFDFNGDGKLDGLERAAENWVFMKMMSECEKEKSEEDETLLNSSDFDESAELINELEAVGLDLFDLECMEEEERREILREAGFDPEDFGF